LLPILVHKRLTNDLAAGFEKVVGQRPADKNRVVKEQKLLEQGRFGLKLGAAENEEGRPRRIESPREIFHFRLQIQTGVTREQGRQTDNGSVGPMANGEGLVDENFLTDRQFGGEGRLICLFSSIATQVFQNPERPAGEFHQARPDRRDGLAPSTQVTDNRQIGAGVQ